MNDAIPPAHVTPAGENKGNSEPNEDNDSHTNPEALAPEDQPYDNHALRTNSGKSVANITDPEGPDYMGEPEVIDREFAYPTHADPMRYVGPANYGTYLDDEQRKIAEVKRAEVEGREPDLENPPATQGTPLQLVTEVRKYLPGDFVVEADKELPVVVGVAEDNLTGFGDAVHARKVKEANESE